MKNKRNLINFGFSSSCFLNFCRHMKTAESSSFFLSLFLSTPLFSFSSLFSLLRSSILFAETSLISHRALYPLLCFLNIPPSSSHFLPIFSSLIFIHFFLHCTHKKRCWFGIFCGMSESIKRREETAIFLFLFFLSFCDQRQTISCQWVFFFHFSLYGLKSLFIFFFYSS